jgi:hypothetical protein
LPEHHSLFRQVSQNPYLVTEGIDKHPDALDPNAFRESAWNIFEPQYLRRLAALVEEFGRARAQGLGADDPALIAQPVITGRVATVLIEAERRLHGALDRVSGRISLGDLADPDTDDLLDDLAELVLKTGGEVVIVPADRMPARTGLAAIYRF